MDVTLVDFCARDAALHEKAARDAAAEGLTAEEAERREASRGRADKLSIFSLEEIRILPIAREWFVDELLTIGVTLLAAKKGNWKSLIALQVCYALASGKPFWGRAVLLSRVLYLALELDQIAMSERAKRLGPVPDGFDVMFSFRRGTEALVDLEALLMERGYRVVVVDMLPAILPAGIDGNGYEQVTSFMLALRRLAQRYNACILCLTHSPKSSRDDFADAVIGSVGFGGQADSIIYLDRKRGDQVGKVMVTGNHGKDQVFKIQIDPNTLELSLADSGSNCSFLSAEREAVQSVLRDNPQGLSVEEIALFTGKPAPATKTLVYRMVEDGQACRILRGRFGLPEEGGSV